MSLAALIATQRADYGIPHAVSCRALDVSQAWFYKWRNGDGSPRRHRGKALAATIAWLFTKRRGTYGSPRIVVDLREMGWRVSVNTVAKLMAEQGLVARRSRRRTREAGKTVSRRRRAERTGPSPSGGFPRSRCRHAGGCRRGASRARAPSEWPRRECPNTAPCCTLGIGAPFV